MSDPLTSLDPPAPDFARMRPVAPLVTIGIPAYNRPHLLRETLASLAAQQNFADFEVVVCDDGELADTRLAVEQCGLSSIRYYVNQIGRASCRERV